MPMYDRKCEHCGTVRFDCWESIKADTPTCECGGAMPRVWLSKGALVVDDSWPGGRTFEHLAHEPQTFYSRSELNRFLKATNQMEFVRHVGEQGSDKSRHTTRWV